MGESFEDIKVLLRDSLEDLMISRKERGELRKLVKSAELTAHQRKVLLSEAQKLALSHADTDKSKALLEWLYEALKISQVESETTAAKPVVYFSPGTACREAICSQIRFARKQMRICVFTISDDEITAEILAAHRRGIDIRIITDDDKSFDLGSDIEKLERAGIDVLTDSSPVHMHHKFALIDEQTVLTGSYNWTRSAATHNYENIVLLKDQNAYKAYDQEFERLWKKLK